MSASLVAGAVFALSAPAATPVAAAASCPAGVVIQTAGNQLMAAAKAGTRSKFLVILKRYGDLPYIATRAIGKYKKKLPASQRKKYNDLVALYVAKGLAEHSRKFTGRGFKVVRCKGNRVETSVQRGTRFHKIVWKMRKRNGYKIVDINVQNIWVGEALKTDLAKVMSESKGDYRALFAYLDKWSKQSW
ncbi:MAG: ABC transporter substrate-binding protein [Hyphomicrobiales bacterium]